MKKDSESCAYTISAKQEQIDDGGLHYWHRLHFAFDYLLSLLRLRYPILFCITCSRCCIIPLAICFTPA